MKFPTIFLSLFFFASPVLADSKVVTSIKPLHSLVAAVMEGDENQPLLLVDGKTSLHSFSLKPSQMQALTHADMVFYMGDDFELFMGKALDSLPVSVKRFTMDKVAGMVLYPVRLGGGSEELTHDGHEHDAQSGNDLHLWMSPINAKLMATAISNKLSEIYPEKKTLYQNNVANLLSRLDSLDAGLRVRMLRLTNKPFVVFHDAYQYYEKDYGLNNLGWITVSREHAISAKHVSALRGEIKNTGARCVFSEPQFDGKITANLIEGTNARAGTLDPEGALIEPGPELYFRLIEAVAAGLEACLAP